MILAGADVDLHADLLAEFIENYWAERVNGAQVVGSTLDAWLAGSTPAAFLAEHAPMFRAMVASKGEDRRNRTRAMLEGRIARFAELRVEQGENRDVGRELVSLSARLINLQWTDAERVRRVINGLSAVVLKIPALLAADRVGSKEAITSVFNLWADAIGMLAQRTLPSSEVDSVVRDALIGWDCADVGKNIVDVVNKVILGRMIQSPEFGSWVKDELWPVSGPGMNEAIGLSFTVYERTRPTSMSLELAQRDDCPPAVAAIIHHRWRD
ncbi:hypothetical protein ACQPZ2_11340 [Nocardia pseudovaccinii]|uniref:hypothetical protein n=1 Tax=Nocardia pseudovaccinii TaxID=189540 RepID=UPI003D91C4EE